MGEQGCCAVLDVVVSHEDKAADGHAISCGGKKICPDEANPLRKAARDVVKRLDFFAIELPAPNSCLWWPFLCHGAEGSSGSSAVDRNRKPHRCTLRTVVARVCAMSRSCAKPICSDPAVSWFDLSRVTQQVTRSSVPTELGIALCESHAERFSVPDGWTLETGVEPVVADDEARAIADVSLLPGVGDVHEASEDQDVLEEQDAPGDEDALRHQDAEDVPVERHRSHDRDNPWFVGAVAEVDESQPGEDAGDWSLGDPTEGSLLHRAFHGPAPTEDGDSSTADTTGTAETADTAGAPVDELSPRRRARSSSDDAEEEVAGGYREFELPFPPHSPRSQRVAVS